MKSKHLSLLFIAGIIVVTVPFANLIGSTSNPPDGRSGSIGDNGANCTGCHNTFAAESAANLIVTNVPVEGYTPGETYTITIEGLADQSSTKYGMQVTAEDGLGNAVGTFLAGTGTAVSGKYIEHSPAFSGSNPNWEFTWTAPSSDVGDITFYGAFVIANSAGGNTGDRVKTSTTVISANPTNGLRSENANVNASIHNNQLTLQLPEVISNPIIQIFTLDGKVVVSKGLVNESSKMFIVNLPSNIAKGSYFVKVSDGVKVFTTKIIK